MENLAQEDPLGLPVCQVKEYLESKENQGHRDTQELESQVCQECQGSQEPWECPGQKAKLDPKVKLGPWAFQDHKDLQGLMDFLALGNQVGQGCQGSREQRVIEDPRARQDLQACRALRERRALGCQVCQALRVPQGCTDPLAPWDFQEWANRV